MKNKPYFPPFAPTDPAYSAPYIQPPLPPFQPGYTPAEAMHELNSRVNAMNNTYNMTLARCYEVLNNMQKAAVADGVFYSDDVITKNVATLTRDDRTKSNYFVYRIKQQDEQGKPVIMDLKYAGDDTTGTGTYSIYDASLDSLSNIIIPAANHDPFGHCFYHGVNIINNVQNNKYLLAFLKDGTMKVYASSIPVDSLMAEGVWNSIGVYDVSVENGKARTPENWNYHNPTNRETRIAIGQALNGDYLIIEVPCMEKGSQGGEVNYNGATSQEMADLLVQYGALIGCEVGSSFDDPCLLYRGVADAVPNTADWGNTYNNVFWYVSKKDSYSTQYQRDTNVLAQNYGRTLFKTDFLSNNLDSVSQIAGNTENEVTKIINGQTSLPYIKSEDGEGTGTTKVENIIVSGDAVVDNLDVTGRATVPTPTNDTDAATKAYVDGATGAFELVTKSKTFSYIKAIIDANKIPVLTDGISNSYMYPYKWDTLHIYFGCWDFNSETFQIQIISSDNSWTENYGSGALFIKYDAISVDMEKVLEAFNHSVPVIAFDDYQNQALLVSLNSTTSPTHLNFAPLMGTDNIYAGTRNIDTWSYDINTGWKTNSIYFPRYTEDDSTAIDGDVLTYQNHRWVAQTPSDGSKIVYINRRNTLSEILQYISDGKLPVYFDPVEQAGPAYLEQYSESQATFFSVIVAGGKYPPTAYRYYKCTLDGWSNGFNYYEGVMSAHINVTQQAFHRDTPTLIEIPESATAQGFSFAPGSPIILTPLNAQSANIFTQNKLIPFYNDATSFFISCDAELVTSLDFVVTTSNGYEGD